MKKYNIPEETLPYLSIEDQLSDLKEMIKFLHEAGIDSTNTRIERYCQFFEASVNNNDVEASKFFPNSVGKPFESEIDWILYIMREINELLWIVKGIKEKKPKGIGDKLKDIVSGADFATLDQNNISRDLQFELRIASYFCQIGWEVDLSQLTDIIVHAPKFNLYIECKRVGNSKKLPMRLREAKNQINKRIPKKIKSKPCYSSICLDVTKVAFPHNGLVFGLTPEHTKDTIQQKIVEIADSIDDAYYFNNTKKLLDIWFQIHIPALVMHPKLVTTRFSNFEILNQNVGRKARNALIKVLELKESVIDDPRLNPPEKLDIVEKIILPAGTKFAYENDSLEHFLNGTFDFDPNSDEVMLTVIIDEKKVEFFSFDFHVIMHQFSAKDRERLSENKNEAMFEIMGALFLSKFPYGLDDFLNNKIDDKHT